MERSWRWQQEFEWHDIAACQWTFPLLLLSPSRRSCLADGRVLGRRGSRLRCLLGLSGCVAESAVGQRGRQLVVSERARSNHTIELPAQWSCRLPSRSARLATRFVLSPFYLYYRPLDFVDANGSFALCFQTRAERAMEAKREGAKAKRPAPGERACWPGWLRPAEFEAGGWRLAAGVSARDGKGRPVWLRRGQFACAERAEADANANANAAQAGASIIVQLQVGRPASLRILTSSRRGPGARWVAAALPPLGGPNLFTWPVGQLRA